MSDPITMSTIVADVTTMFTAAIQWLTSVVTTVMANPLLEAFVIVAFIGIGISIFKRLAK